MFVSGKSPRLPGNKSDSLVFPPCGSILQATTFSNHKHLIIPDLPSGHRALRVPIGADPWLTLGLVRCCSLLSSLSLCSRSNSSLISAGVLLLSTTCGQNQEERTVKNPGSEENTHKRWSLTCVHMLLRAGNSFPPGL